MKAFWLGVFFLFFSFDSLGATTYVSHFQDGIRYTYRIKLLELALNGSAQNSDTFILTPKLTDVTQARGLLLVEQGKIDVVFLATNNDRERRFLAVKIPILRGILGYRVFLIHKESTFDFGQVNRLSELKEKFIAGFGSQWSDMAILKHNQLIVEGLPQYEILFKMLNVQRFDYFPRGINEAWAEVASKGNAYPDIIVEQNIGLYYEFPVYFFVNKTNDILARRIEEGLQRMLKDGSFKKLFLDFHKAIIDQAKLKQRKLFLLENPTIPKGTPEIDTSWWLN